MPRFPPAVRPRITRLPGGCLASGPPFSSFTHDARRRRIYYRPLSDVAHCSCDVQEAPGGRRRSCERGLAGERKKRGRETAPVGLTPAYVMPCMSYIPYPPPLRTGDKKGSGVLCQSRILMRATAAVHVSRVRSLLLHICTLHHQAHSGLHTCTGSQHA